MTSFDETCVFILSHERAENIRTLKLLEKYHTKLPIYIVVDDEDTELKKYLELYDNVLVFNKKEIRNEMNIDMCDNFDEYCNCVVPRNVCFKFAKELGYKYFLELDDDYTQLATRYRDGDILPTKNIDLDSFDAVMKAYLDFLESTGADAVALAQGGDYIGGLGSVIYKRKLIRKLMNWIFCRTDTHLKFTGTLNDDVTLYTLYGSRGHLFLTPYQIRTDQQETQSEDGGLTNIYLNNGTYTKSFYTVINMPSGVKISVIGSNANGNKAHYRIHHKVKWNNVAPKILNEKYRRTE